jgi:RNA-directed DNA polymerase
LLIKPAKKNVLTFMRRIREIVKEARTAKQETVIAWLKEVAGEI